MNPTDIDLTEIKGVLQYLQGTQFAAKAADLLVGGVANFTYRVHLEKLYEGQSTVICKHAEAYAALAKSIELDANRLNIETGTMSRIKSFIPTDSFVLIPTIYFHDSDKHVIIMEDCGDVRTLKDVMIDDPLPKFSAEAVGGGLGTFLATVHDKGSRDAELLKFCGSSEGAKTLEAWRSFGRLMDTLTGEGKAAGLIEPPLSLPQTELVKVAKLIDHYTNAIVYGRHDTFTMGDLWPGNILLKTNRNPDGDLTVERVYVVDWELAKPGLQGLDIGQLTAEMRTLCRVHPASETSTTNLLSAFFKGYSHGRTVENQCIKDAAIYTGVHIVNGIARNDWGKPSKELIRSTVLEGLEHILNMDDAWLRQSFIGELIAE